MLSVSLPAIPFHLDSQPNMPADNQWPVDFNLTLASFEPHIKGIRGLVDFALQSQKAASILFVSSVGVVKNQQSNATIPEALLTDFSSAEAGYGRSKLVSEMVLAEAYQKSGVSCCVCRIGQIAGPVDSKEGMWNKQEWLPSVRLGILRSHVEAPRLTLSHS